MKKKIAVGILGATGSVGQKFIELLQDHPFFEIKALCASQRNTGKLYGTAVQWFQEKPCPEEIAKMPIQACEPGISCQLVFSGLDSSVAGEIESKFAQAGYVVISNSRNHRMDEDVPLLIPEVNPEHLGILDRQTTTGRIITNPNCSTIGLALALKPLWDAFGLEAVQVVTFQALSGAGYPGVSSLDILDNVVPYISGEEEKMESEPAKIFGKLISGSIVPASMRLSAQCNRVAVVNGHLERVSVKLGRKADLSEVNRVFRDFQPEIASLELPSSPERCLHLHTDPLCPQPRKHRNLGDGMTVSIGHVKSCAVLDYKFSLLVHNTIRGAAGGAILNAELMAVKGLI